MELDYKAIGTRIRRLRKELGLTQQTLAEYANQEPSNISHIERGATKLSLPYHRKHCKCPWNNRRRITLR